MAERTKGTKLRVETARAGVKTISGITQANPAVVTADAHGYSAGDIAYLADIGGMISLNDRAFVVANPSTNTFELKGVDSTSLSAYTSGGSAYKVTLTQVAEVNNLTIGGGGSSQIEVTNFDSEAVEQLPGLPNLGSLSCGITLNHTDAGQKAMRSIAEATVPKVITVTTASGYVLCATGNTSNYGAEFALNAAQNGSFEFSIYRRPTWFA